MPKRFPMIIIVTAVALAFCLPILLRSALTPELPNFGPVPSYSFTDETNQKVTNQQLLGHVNLINFFFTSCPGPCPKLMADIARVERELNDKNLSLVSISIDPEWDSPEALANYKAKFQPTVATWHFVTGEKSAITKFSEQGLKLALGDDISMHSIRTVLVDKNGDMRGAFNPDQEFDLLILAMKQLS